MIIQSARRRKAAGGCIQRPMFRRAWNCHDAVWFALSSEPVRRLHPRIEIRIGYRDWTGWIWPRACESYWLLNHSAFRGRTLLKGAPLKDVIDKLSESFSLVFIVLRKVLQYLPYLLLLYPCHYIAIVERTGAAAGCLLSLGGYNINDRQCVLCAVTVVMDVVRPANRTRRDLFLPLVPAVGPSVTNELPPQYPPPEAARPLNASADHLRCGGQRKLGKNYIIGVDLVAAGDPRLGLLRLLVNEYHHANP